MATVHELIAKIENPELRERIAAEVDKLTKQKKFGLVFEEHLPECTPLYDVPIRKGAKVALRTGKVSDFYTVLRIEDGKATCLNKDKNSTVEFAVNELVSIAEFGEPIYPYLKPIDSVCNAPDSDLWHTLIEADNYHALQLLEYLYAGKVDCIYIDPPYNTGARDWKYNNDYVDNADTYRHSKWLSMMQKRLKLAKKLLKPQNSVLIVTIDEKEYLHLGCLLEELFFEADIEMVTSVINARGKQRTGKFARTEEYIFFIKMGNAVVRQEEDPDYQEGADVPWRTMRRSSLAGARGKHGAGACGPNQFFPVYVSHEGLIVDIGKSLPEDQEISDFPAPNGTTAVFPLRDDGTEMNWGITDGLAIQLWKKGYIRVGRHTPKKPQKWELSYYTSGKIEDIESGRAVIVGKNPDGSVQAKYVESKLKYPTSVWVKQSHNAETEGTNLLKAIYNNENRFTYPKSLYAVKDSIALFIGDKPDAIIVDFFAGSGTTLHAVNLLNAEDGGHRRCIMVTNNEVSDAEAKEMKARGLNPGDAEWEKLGIARYVTWPRTVCSIEGHDVNGNPLRGNYIGSGIPMSDGFKANAVYFKLGFLDKTKVSLGRQFKELLSTLWMKAGAHGPCPAVDEGVPDMLILPENRMAILNDENSFGAFAEQLSEYPEIDVVYIVTDYEAGFAAMTAALPGKTTYQLYRDYLDNFRINAGRNAR